MSSAPLPRPRPKGSLFECPVCGERYKPRGPTGDQFFCAGGKVGPKHAPVKMEVMERALESDIVAEPITAYRAWRLGSPLPTVTPEFRLMAWAIGNTEWAKGANKARCLANQPVFAPQPHTSPFSSCKCGFWAFSSEEVLAERIGIGSQPGRKQYAWGKVQIWGRIIEGVRSGQVGYRAEYAKPEEIVIVRPYDEFRDIIPEQIASYYEVKVSLGGGPKRATLQKRKIMEGGRW